MHLPTIYYRRRRYQNSWYYETKSENITIISYMIEVVVCTWYINTLVDDYATVTDVRWHAGLPRKLHEAQRTNERHTFEPSERPDYPPSVGILASLAMPYHGNSPW